MKFQKSENKLATKTKISILGCGWLGFPLAEQLISEGFSVKGSTTSESKISMLESSGIDVFLIALDANDIHGNITAFLNDADILIIAIPPKLRTDTGENFVAKIKALLPHIENSGVQKMLFISSTSVYADDNSVIDETKVPNPDSENGRQLYETEQLLQQNTNFKTTILRFGGLIGSDRHPIKYLAGRKNIDNPRAPINLIHQSDCIGIIQCIIRSEKWGETYNAAAPFHPTREKYYTDMARLRNLPLPHFNHEIESVGKTIDSQKLQRELAYRFKMAEL